MAIRMSGTAKLFETSATGLFRLDESRIFEEDAEAIDQFVTISSFDTQVDLLAPIKKGLLVVDFDTHRVSTLLLPPAMSALPQSIPAGGWSLWVYNPNDKDRFRSDLAVAGFEVESGAQNLWDEWPL